MLSPRSQSLLALISLSNYGEAAPAAAAAGGKKAEVKKGGAAGGALTLGQFTFEPATGRVEPGSRTVSQLPPVAELQIRRVQIYIYRSDVFSSGQAHIHRVQTPPAFLTCIRCLILCIPCPLPPHLAGGVSGLQGRARSHLQ